MPTASRSQERAYVAKPRKQSEVAAKAAFATVAANGPEVKGAVDARDIAGALRLEARPGAFVGTVASVYEAPRNACVILNFDKDYLKGATAVLLPPYYADFPDLAMLKGKRVLVSGRFVRFKGGPEILLRKPDQIRVVLKK